MSDEPAPRRIVIDTDPGIDDALAILLAVDAPELQLEALTVVGGNCTFDRAVSNALAVVELAGADVPVAGGTQVPLVRPPVVAEATHGMTGLGYAQLAEPSSTPSGVHGVDLLIDLIMSNPGEITVVALGPLTNLAMAIRREPRIVDDVHEVLIMGGAIRAPGNITPLAEFNVYCDPHAAYVVFHSGMPATLVPLDVTYKAILTGQDVARLLEIESPVTRFIADSTRYYMEFHREHQGVDGCAINDPLVVALAFAPGLVMTERHPVDVDISDGPSLGKTFADFYRVTDTSPNMDVTLNIRERNFIELFVDRMAAFAEQRPDIPENP